MNRQSTLTLAAVIALSAFTGTGNAQNFEVGSFATLLQQPYCSEDYAMHIAYEAGVKGYHLPASASSYFILGVDMSNGRDAGVTINSGDCSIRRMVANPTDVRPYCHHLANPGIRCGIQVHPALAQY